ncbi:MAG: hypothetical protein ACFFDW_06780 [Candidatus Thorarchaeota archaeon]
MPPKEKLDLNLDDSQDNNKEEEEEEETDELRLELHKEEKDTKPPLPISKILLIFAAITIVSIGLAISIAAIANAAFPSSPRDFGEWVVIFLMMFGGLGIISGGIAGFWGGQRNIPIRLVSPSDASVVGVGLLICGYAIEDCMDNEIELTIYNKNKEAIYEELLPIDKNGIFFTEINDNLFSSKKTEHIVVEAWMVSQKTIEMKFVRSATKLEEMNVYSQGIKVGKLHFFPKLYRDFSDKAKAIYDPKRKEKGIIENVKINETRSTNIFFPSKSADDKYVSFSIERVVKMRQNALFSDIKRSRRVLMSLFLFAMSLAFFIYPIISVIIYT